jgi:hypothetical protein
MKKGIVLVSAMILLLVSFDLIVFFNLNKPTQSENTMGPSIQQEASSNAQFAKTCAKDDPSCGVMVVEVNLLGFWGK